MIDRTEQRLGLKPHRLAADTAYGSAATLNWIVNEKKIAPHIPVIDKSMREDGTLSRADFTFDKNRNVTRPRFSHGTLLQQNRHLADIVTMSANRSKRTLLGRPSPMAI